jgi:GNAT superfamily N-acetyltransferase
MQIVAPAFDVRPIDLRAATAHEYGCLNALRNVIRGEILPQDPPWPCSEDIRRWQARPTVVEEHSWAAWENSNERILALAQAKIYRTGDNPHILWFDIQVLPEFRRRGMARSMLRLIVDRARREQRPLLMNECNDRVPAAAAFLTRLGASQGLEEPVNELQLRGLDHSLLERWLERESDLSVEFELGLWDQPYPDERLQDISDLLQEVANDQPRDSLQMEDTNFTPDLIRQWDAEQRAGGDQRWTLYLTGRLDGALVAVSEVYWNPNRPHILWQGFTGVMPANRGRGLGRWLKARMLMKVLQERPQVQVIRAGNATSNAPMLKINRTLGFKQLVSWSIWQVELESVERYLVSAT